MGKKYVCQRKGELVKRGVQELSVTSMKQCSVMREGHGKMSMAGHAMCVDPAYVCTMCRFCVKCVWISACHDRMCVHLDTAVWGVNMSASENPYLSV